MQSLKTAFPARDQPFRRAAFAVMCVGQRLRGSVSAGATPPGANAPPHLALPDELWMAVLSCCGRDWWGE